MEEMNYRSESITDVTALKNAAFAACQQFDKQSGRFFESMGETSPRLLAVVKAMDDLKAELYRLDHAGDATKQPQSVWLEYQSETPPQGVVKGFESAEDECVATLLNGVPEAGGSATKKNFEMLVRMAFQGGLCAAAMLRERQQ